MTAIDIKFNPGNSLRKLRQYRRRVNNLSPAMNRIGRDLAADARRRMIRQVDYVDKKLTPSQAAIREGRKTLIKSGRLLNSWTHRTIPGLLRVFSTAPYYRHLHRGRRNMPARKIFGLGMYQVNLIKRRIVDYLHRGR